MNERMHILFPCFISINRKVISTKISLSMRFGLKVIMDTTVQHIFQEDNVKCITIAFARNNLESFKGTQLSN